MKGLTFLFLWIKAHLIELLHHVLLWHWAWLTVRRVGEFSVFSLEHSVNTVLIVVWVFSVWRHFRHRLCNKKTVRDQV